MRKKLTCMALILILSLFISTSAYAASTKTYTLDEVGISVDLPNDLVVFTRDIDKYDPNLEAYGLTADQLTQIFTSGNIYLNAWNEDIDFEIIVTMIPSSLNDFSQINDDILTDMATNSSSEYAKGGITYIKSDIYQTAGTKFLKVYISQIKNGSTVYGLQYYTVVDGKAINITMQSYAGKISSSNESYLKTIADNAVFKESTLSAESEIPQTDSFVYTDSKTNTTFTVPAGWTEKPDSGETIDAKFVPNDGSIQIIVYSCHDTWNAMTPEEKAGYTRADINNSYLTKSDIADMFGISASEVSIVTYNGVDYYKCETETADNSLNRDIQMTILFNISNGYIYLFQFAGTSSSAHFAEFEEVLSSVKFSSASPAPVTAGASTSPIPSSVPAQTQPFTYTDMKSDSALTVPAGWAQEPVIDNKYLQVQFIPDDGTGEIIMFGVYDLWVNTPVKDRAGHTRFDVNNAFLTEESLSEVMGVPASQITTAAYRGEHFKCELNMTGLPDSGTEILGTKLLYIQDGMMYMFQFAGTGSSKHYRDFEKMVDMAVYSYKAPGGVMAASLPSSKPVYSATTGDDFQSRYATANILLSLLITVAVYTLPIALYRFVIRQSPVERRTAKIIVIIYAICAFIAMILIVYLLGGSITSSGGIILWSWINYKILISGLPKEVLYSGISPVNMPNYYAQTDTAANDPPRQTTYTDDRGSQAPGPAAEPPDIPPEDNTEENKPPDNSGDDSDSSSWGKPLF